jgi:hypothetical protein
MLFIIKKLRETNFGHMIVELVGNPILTLELIGIDADLENELEELEGAFERDEIMDL